MSKGAAPSIISYHLLQALAASVAEIDGDEAQSRRLHAEVKLRLINMSDEELWELAKIAKPPEQSIEASYRKFKQAIEEHRATANEWMKDLPTKCDIGQREMMPTKILVIEKAEFLREKLVSFFTQAGFATAEACDYHGAQSAMVSFSPDLIIMDTILSDRDGFEACSELYTSLGIPIILVGQEGSDKAWPRAVESGAGLYLIKPFVCDKALVARVKAIVRRYRKGGNLRHEK